MKPITIVGGGLAGLSLGIALRERDVPVTVYESGHYPRHRVCGEFISGAGQRMVARLRLPAIPAKTAAFAAKPGKSFRLRLPEPATCVSRYVLDKALADEFRASGGNLICGMRSDSEGEGAVHATGRRLHPVENGWRWFGLKAHVTDIDLEADLEMHLVPNGYVGICRLAGGRFNVCGLFRKRKGNLEKATLRGPEGSSLHARLKSATWIEDSFSSVAGVCFCPPVQDGECHIGDAHAMIAPLTGNGMSMAFESAEMATEPLTRYAQGDIIWQNAVQEIAGTSRKLFASRLCWGKRLQWMAFQPWLLPLCSRVVLAKLLFAATR